MAYTRKNSFTDGTDDYIGSQLAAEFDSAGGALNYIPQGSIAADSVGRPQLVPGSVVARNIQDAAMATAHYQDFSITNRALPAITGSAWAHLENRDYLEVTTGDPEIDLIELTTELDDPPGKVIIKFACELKPLRWNQGFPPTASVPPPVDYTFRVLRGATEVLTHVVTLQMGTPPDFDWSTALHQQRVVYILGLDTGASKGPNTYKVVVSAGPRPVAGAFAYEGQVRLANLLVIEVR